MKTVLLIASLLLCACGRSDETSEVDNQVMCSLEGKAYIMKPGAGDVTFVRRSASADKVCMCHKERQ